MMNNNEEFEVEYALFQINEEVTGLYGSLQAMAADWKAEELERLDWLGDDEVIELVFN